jgi:hypothetical protein
LTDSAAAWSASAVHEAARCAAILEAIDRDLDARGLVDKAGRLAIC